MAIFALADLHLGLAVDKSMDIFGPQWVDHAAKIEERWRAVVTDNDTVLLPGDLSWGMTLSEAMPDLLFIDALPGRKIMIRGNHDYWWSKINRLRKSLPPSLCAMQNDVVELEGVVIAGTRGWDLPGEGFVQDVATTRTIFERERGRLRLSLETARGRGPIIAMMHYPPRYRESDHAGFSDILEEFAVETVVFGHLHGPDGLRAVRGEMNGVRYVFCASDGVDFRPVRIR